MPEIEQTHVDDNVCSHTFRFMTPAMKDSYQDPEPVQSVSYGKVHKMGNASSRAVARSFAEAHPEVIYPSAGDSEAGVSGAQQSWA